MAADCPLAHIDTSKVLPVSQAQDDRTKNIAGRMSPVLAITGIPAALS